MPKRKLLLLTLGGVTALLAGVWLLPVLILPGPVPAPTIASATKPGAPPAIDLPARHGYMIHMPELRAVSDFRLIQPDGQSLTPENLKGRWSFLYFGYTFCPDACPLTLNDLKRLQQRLAQQGLDGEVAYWFVSVDPERDTPQHLGEYVKYFYDKFQAATGDPQELAKLTRQLNVSYRISEHPRGDLRYSVDHPSTIVLIDPDGRFHAIFMPPHDPDRMAADFAKNREEYWASH